MKQLGKDWDKIKKCVEDSVVKNQNETRSDIYINDNSLLKNEQTIYNSVVHFGQFPLIIIDGVVYQGNINIKDFINFNCKNEIFDCRQFKS